MPETEPLQIEGHEMVSIKRLDSRFGRTRQAYCSCGGWIGAVGSPTKVRLEHQLHLREVQDTTKTPLLNRVPVVRKLVRPPRPLGEGRPRGPKSRSLWIFEPAHLLVEVTGWNYADSHDGRVGFLPFLPLHPGEHRDVLPKELINISVVDFWDLVREGQMVELRRSNKTRQALLDGRPLAAT